MWFFTKQVMATIYQQKAVDINERELGLDHPDTMKSYGTFLTPKNCDSFNAVCQIFWILQVLSLILMEMNKLRENSSVERFSAKFLHGVTLYI
ncbi:hypothetical protein AHAS_Ahas17G0188500 [Arachis hypogaea]